MVLATALTLASVGSSLLGSGMSFTNAMKQNKIKDQAEKDADAAMKAARKSLEKNYMDSLAIQKEPYELEREAMLSAGAQATEVARESERGAGRVGAIYAQQQQGQRQIASAMGQEMFNLDYLSTQEDTRLRDLNTQLDLGEVEGAQLQAANAEERRQQQLMAGAQGIGNAAATGLDALSLYSKDKSIVDTKGLNVKPNTVELTGLRRPTYTDGRGKRKTSFSYDPFATNLDQFNLLGSTQQYSPRGYLDSLNINRGITTQDQSLGTIDNGFQGMNLFPQQGLLYNFK
jgi:hypothetical protein